MADITLVSPFFNESPSVSQVWEGVLNLLRNHPEFNVIFVDDGSYDGSTFDLKCRIENLKSDQPELFGRIHLVKHQSNGGYGAAIKTGLSQVQSTWAGFFDFDGTIELEDFPKLFHHAVVNDLDMVVGNRMGTESAMLPVRKTGNEIFAKLARWKTGSEINDLCSGVRVFKSSWIQQIRDELPDDLNFSLALTLMVLKKNGCVEEQPIHYYDRLGQSKLNELRHGVQFFLSILKYY